MAAGDDISKIVLERDQTIATHWHVGYNVKSPLYPSKTFTTLASAIKEIQSIFWVELLE